MTSDDQLHLLRNQIAEYETLSGQLARLQAAIRTSLSGLTSTASFYPHEYDIATQCHPTLCGQTQTFNYLQQTHSGQLSDGMGIGNLCPDTLVTSEGKNSSLEEMGMENLCPDTSIMSGDGISLAGILGMENFHPFSSATPGGFKLTSRKRWTPTPTQLQVLESMFGEGIVTPNKQKIKDITDELSQHGQISDTNVYNWFQNRKARSKKQQSKRKQTAALSNSKPDQFGTEVAPKRQKNDKSEVTNTALVNLPSVGDQIHSSAKTNTESHSSQAHETVSYNNSAESSISFESMSYYDTLLSSPDFDRFMEEWCHLLD